MPRLTADQRQDAIRQISAALMVEGWHDFNFSLEPDISKEDTLEEIALYVERVHAAAARYVFVVEE
jgi:hypothetical protein